MAKFVFLGLSLIFGAASILGSLGVVALQVWSWLKTGEWQPVPLGPAVTQLLGRPITGEAGLDRRRDYWQLPGGDAAQPGVVRILRAAGVVLRKHGDPD